MSMRPRTYRILEMAVESGVEYGYNRAYKHTDDPSDERIKQSISEAVLLEISEWFDVDDEDLQDRTDVL